MSALASLHPAAQVAVVIMAGLTAIAFLIVVMVKS